MQRERGGVFGKALNAAGRAELLGLYNSKRQCGNEDMNKCKSMAGREIMHIDDSKSFPELIKEDYQYVREVTIKSNGKKKKQTEYPVGP